jgi:Glycosyltransferase family 87
MVASLRMPRSRPRLFAPALIVALFVWYVSGVEAWRRGNWGEIGERPSVLLTRPFQALRAYVSREGDDHLYYEYAELMVGGAGDLPFIARKSPGNEPATALDRLKLSVRAGPGWRLPYRDFPVEYPPLPLVLMLVPRLAVDSLAAYRVVLGLLLGALFLVTCGAGARLSVVTAMSGSPDPVWRRMAWLALAIGPLLCSRFDLLPAALVACALYAFVRRRDVVAGVLFGLAVMTKLYPLLLLLPVLAFLWGGGERRRALAIGGAVAVAALAVAAPFLLTAPEPFMRAVGLYGERPLHFESQLGAVVLALEGPAALVRSYGSSNVMTPLWLGRLADLSLLVGMLAVAAGALRAGGTLRRASDEERSSVVIGWIFVALVAILCLSKVLSPQFLIWLLPLCAVFPALQGRRIFALTLLTAVLTHLFIGAGFHRASQQPGSVFALGMLLTRNAMLLVLGALALRVAAVGPRDFAGPR